MSDLVYSLINVNYLTTGRRLYALRHCLESVTGSEPLLGALIETAIAHDLQTADMERSWARSRNVSKARGEAAAVDAQIDGVYGAIHGTLKNHVAVLPQTDPIVQASTRILTQLFPEGVAPIVTLPFEDQLVLNDSNIARFAGDLRDAAATAGISAYTERLTALNESFRAELGKSETKEMSYDRIEAAQTAGNLNLRRVVAVVLGTYYADTPEAAERRQTLLSPILDQCERIRRSRKGRRPPQDIDPETGIEIPETPAE